MSKESEAIYNAHRKGEEDGRNKKGYINPYKKNKEKLKRIAYHSGYLVGQSFAKHQR